MRRYVLTLVAAAAAHPLSAQVTCPAAGDSASNAAAPAEVVRLLAYAHIAQLRFSHTPSATAETSGCPGEAAGVRVVQRRNLPEPVQPGVTYGDVEVAVEIRGGLQVLCSPLLQRLLADASTSGTALVRMCAPDPQKPENGMSRRNP